MTNIIVHYNYVSKGKKKNRQKLANYTYSILTIQSFFKKSPKLTHMVLIQFRAMLDLICEKLMYLLKVIFI